VFHLLEQRIQETFQKHIATRYALDVPIVIEQPKQPDFGELALPVAFHLAKQLKQAPRKIAAELVADIGAIDGIAALEVAGNGYINVRFDRARYGQALLDPPPEMKTPSSEKIIVEHTNINPNKAAHIGHLRNATLGDTFVRMLRGLGKSVEVQNYIDNTGVQVADVVVGFQHIRPMPLEQVEVVAEQPRFDYYCWDLYADVSAHYEKDPTALQLRRDALHSIERGVGGTSRLAEIISNAIVKAHLNTMLRLGVKYDVLPRESEILRLHFWDAAFALLQERGAVVHETQGKNDGCWVMRAAAFSEGSEDDKVIVRSNGTVTYVGKDIAYQLWKFGLLGKDFFYRKLDYNKYEVWVTTNRPPDPKSQIPSFGRATRVYNVIDVRQSYLQDVVVAGLRALGFNQQADQSVHFSYEMVALSPRCAAELGIEVPGEDRNRPVEVSGRKGFGVKADDLIDKLISKALDEVASRHAEASAEEQRSIATQIAIGALRYFLLKFTRSSVIAFDFQEALSFEGETGPYVQYAAVRARNISRKLEQKGERVPDFRAELNAAAFGHQLQSEDFWQLLLAASKADRALERAVTAGEPAHVAKYAFQVAQAFNNFYHLYPIIHEQNREKKVFLLWMTDFFRSQLERTLDVLGIEVPAYM